MPTQTPEQTSRQISPDEPCPGLKEWETCTYVHFGHNMPDSRIAGVCIGNYLSCPRYLHHLSKLAKQKRTGLEDSEIHSQSSPKCRERYPGDGDSVRTAMADAFEECHHTAQSSPLRLENVKVRPASRRYARSNPLNVALRSVSLNSF